MKRNNKKGFTIVELVIVIAVIAILSAVLIPTFGGIVEKAEDSANKQNARNEYTEYLVEHPTADIDYVEIEGKYYSVSTFNAAPVTTLAHGDVVLKDNALLDPYCGAEEDTCTIEGCWNTAPVTPAP